ncbi:MAG: M6 family metalloprotease domain-containing protein [Bacteroidales bacterium]|nr:M6 family metalloprotease domain-containing protein [Candidatus Physcousia equi]
MKPDKMRRGSLAALMLLVVVSAVAVPARRVRKTITLRDGTTEEVVLRGDERVHFYESADGATFQGNEEIGFAPIERQDLVDAWQVRMESSRTKMTQRRALRKARWGAEANPIEGKRRGIVLLVNFSDQKMNNAHNQAFYDRYFNEVGFDDDGMSGSVHDYFYSCSYGKLDLEFDVVGPLTVSKTMSYYGSNDANGNDKYAATMVAEAVHQAIEQGVDFSLYDWDKDGEVEQVFVIYAGRSEAQGAPHYCIWPHEYSLSEAQETGDGNGVIRTNQVVIDTYACSSELRGVSGTKVDGIGTACHEFSHCMCIPDMYDINYENYGMDIWDVMDGGSYMDKDGYGYGTCPMGYTSYERMYCGWLTPQEITDYKEVGALRSLAKWPDAYIIRNKANRNEYYMLENRQREDFFQSCYGHGMMVLHVFYSEQVWGVNEVNTTSGTNSGNRYERMTIVPANGKKVAYDTSSSSDFAGIFFPGTTGTTALSNTTTPKAALYTNNSDGRKLLNVPISNIAEDNAAGSISFVAGVKPTGISSTCSTAQMDERTDLLGRRWSTPPPHGIYVKNAKKYRVKH